MEAVHLDRADVHLELAVGQFGVDFVRMPPELHNRMWNEDPPDYGMVGIITCLVIFRIYAMAVGFMRRG